ncbi:tetratricopeptide repeat protein, partial [Ursidibacter sp. B-7004-1]
LAVMYDNGQGVKQDDHQAVKWFQKAAEQGNAKAQFLLGASYGLGKGVPQDMVKAKMWFGRACDNGSQDGCDMYRQLNEGK